jgi:hypothetical protein
VRLTARPATKAADFSEAFPLTEQRKTIGPQRSMLRPFVLHEHEPAINSSAMVLRVIDLSQRSFLRRT